MKLDNYIFGLRSIGSLGDCLYLTPAISQIKNPIVKMHDSPQCRRVAPIYNNIAHVEFVDNPDVALYNQTNDRSVHSAQRVLNALKIDTTNCIPRIVLDKSEIDWAKDFLKEYKNPVMIVNDNGGSSTPGNICAQYRRPPTEIIQNFANKLSNKGFTPLQFGIKDLKDRDNAFTPINGAIPIRGLDIRQTAACYHVIGKYIGGDTGDYHLMLSVGGRCITLIPPENHSLGYNYSDLLYTDNLWKDEKVRVKYIDYTKPNLVNNYLNFDF